MFKPLTLSLRSPDSAAGSVQREIDRRDLVFGCGDIWNSAPAESELAPEAVDEALADPRLLEMPETD